AVALMRGTTRDQLIGRDPIEFSTAIQADGTPTVEALTTLTQNLAASGHVRTEWLHQALDGTQVPIDLTLTQTVLQEGPAVLASWHDITERKRTEAILRESEERFRSLSDQAPVLVWVEDEGGQVTYVNTAWLQFTGRTLDDELGRGWLEA